MQHLPRLFGRVRVRLLVDGDLRMVVHRVRFLRACVVQFVPEDRWVRCKLRHFLEPELAVRERRVIARCYGPSGRDARDVAGESRTAQRDVVDLVDVRKQLLDPLRGVRVEVLELDCAVVQQRFTGLPVRHAIVPMLVADDGPFRHVLVYPDGRRRPRDGLRVDAIEGESHQRREEHDYHDTGLREHGHRAACRAGTLAKPSERR